ncbi:NRT1 ribosyltransferase, partial [Cettia cetti]|nr:NRT1 ribosyltransferase [Cettia cetti]
WSLPTMAPLAHTLALLAMAVATAAIEVKPLDMALDSFDDQYLTCHVDMSAKLLEFQFPDFIKNDNYFKSWVIARDVWQKRGSKSSPLTPEQAIALMAYTMNFTKLYKAFNDATHVAGGSRWEYRNKFHFKSLHFLLTTALQKLRLPKDCRVVYRGMAGVSFHTEVGKEVRFGKFTSTSLSETVARGYGQDTMFKVLTCHGADIQKFSYDPSEKEVLIPPFETFKVIKEDKEKKQIELQSNGTFSNYDCEWLKGDIMGTARGDW